MVRNPLQLNIFSMEHSQSFPNKIPASPPLADTEPCILELARVHLKVMHKFGSSRMSVIKEEQGTGHPHFRLAVATDFVSRLMYFGTKLLTLIHFTFFVVRFINTLSYEKDMVVTQLTLSPYIFSLIMMWGIYLVTHIREKKISSFFTRFNELDQFIFGDGTDFHLKDCAYHGYVS